MSDLMTGSIDASTSYGGEGRGRRSPLIAAVIIAVALSAGGYMYYRTAVLPARIAAANAAGLAEAREHALARARAASHAAPAAKPAAVLAGSTRVVPSEHAGELFAPHSWYVAPPPPPPPADAPPPEPTAPPLAYTYMGSYAPVGERPVYFLAKGDRVIDAHIGDRLDGVLLFEKIEGGNLVFNYIPLNIRQTLPAGVVQ
jgi:hypothetical protein